MAVRPAGIVTNRYREIVKELGLITVFGGSRCEAGSSEYQHARKLARLLTESGFAVCAGGKYGVSAALARGAADSRGTLVEIGSGKPSADPDPQIRKIVPSKDYYSRLQTFVRQSRGFVALRGSMGTLSEVTMVWNKLASGVLAPRPFVLLGDGWPRLIRCFRKHMAISDPDLALLSFAASPEEAVAVLIQQS